MDLTFSTIAEAKGVAATHLYVKDKQFLISAAAKLMKYRRFLSAEAVDHVASKITKLSDALASWARANDRSMVKLKLIRNLVKLLKKQLVVVFSQLKYVIMRGMHERTWRKIGLSDIRTRHNLPG